MSGYKSRLAETKFKSFSILFNNGIEIGASRKKECIGSFEYYVSKNGVKIKSTLLVANPDNVIHIEPKSEKDFEYQEVINYIKGLNIATFYLSDDRKIKNTITSDSNTSKRLLENTYIDSGIVRIRERGREIISEKRSESESNLFLEPTIERLQDWIRSKVLSRSKVGEKNSQVIFSDIIKNYIILSETESTIKDKEQLLNELSNLENILPSYVNLGLIDVFDAKTIRSSIKKARTDEQITFLSTIISPFLEGVNAKLVALETVEKTISLFIKTVNDYFTNKTISFNLSTGFEIKQKGSEHLEFSWLSSGEKQLLLLLVNTITSADDATVFIIDEPEISLNIKWQRRLIKTLLAFSIDKNIQFILATHSFELLSAYKSNTSKLIDTIKSNKYRIKWKKLKFTF